VILQPFVLLSDDNRLKLFSIGASIFTVFYGVGWVLRRYLIYKSEYLPKFLGVLMTIASLAFVVSNFAVVLAPKVPSAGSCY
jgi:hypothetical protein